MTDTKEKILVAALELFARNGYEAVSVREIAEVLHITKGALYRHYKNKRDIFDSIVDRMMQMDAQRARDYRMPEEQYDSLPDSYETTTLEDIQTFTIEQLKFWTEDNFASKFRKMLTLEQYRNEEMAELYNRCIVSGPVAYMEDLFRVLIRKGELEGDDPGQLAVEYYAPLFLLIHMFDKNRDAENDAAILRNHTEHFMKRYAVISERSDESDERDQY